MKIDTEKDLVRIIVALMVRLGVDDVFLNEEELDNSQDKYPVHSLMVEVDKGTIRAAMVKEGEELQELPEVQDEKLENKLH